jgi:hypothetical protein
MRRPYHAGNPGTSEPLAQSRIIEARRIWAGPTVCLVAEVLVFLERNSNVLAPAFRQFQPIWRCTPRRRVNSERGDGSLDIQQ